MSQRKTRTPTIPSPKLAKTWIESRFTSNLWEVSFEQTRYFPTRASTGAGWVTSWVSCIYDDLFDQVINTGIAFGIYG